MNDPIELVRRARPMIAAAVSNAQDRRDPEAWGRATALLREIDAVIEEPYTVMMRVLKNEWVGNAAAEVGSPGDRELSDALAQWRNITVDVQGKAMMMRVVERTLDGKTTTFLSWLSHAKDRRARSINFRASNGPPYYFVTAWPTSATARFEWKICAIFRFAIFLRSTREYAC